MSRQDIESVNVGDLLRGERVLYKAAFKDNIAGYATLSLSLLSLLWCLPLFLGFPILYCAFSSLVNYQRLVLTEKSLVYSRAWYDFCWCCCWADGIQFIPLEKITDLQTSVGCLQRRYGITSINVQTAGSGGPGAEMELVGVQDPDAFIAEVNAARRRVQETASAAGPTSGTTAHGSAQGNINDVYQVLVRMEGTLNSINERLAAREAGRVSEAPIPSV